MMKRRKLFTTLLCLVGMMSAICGLFGCEKKVEPHVHAWGEWTVAEENKPTAELEGKATRVCTGEGACDGSAADKEYALPALTSEDYTKSNDSATCSAAGEITYTYANDEVHIEFAVATLVNPEAHTYGIWQNDKAEGHYKICVHNSEHTTAFEPHNQDGDYGVCTVCGYQPGHTHVWSPWAVEDVNKPTLTTEGKATRTCSALYCRASAKDKEYALPILTDSEAYTKSEETAANCTEHGEATYLYNKEGVNVSFRAETPLDPSVHDFTSNEWQQDNADGHYKTCSRNPAHIGELTAHDTNGTNGTCSVCGVGFMEMEYGDTLNDGNYTVTKGTAATVTEGVLTAVGVGVAAIKHDNKAYLLTVKPATVDVVLFTGQSNMVGRETEQYAVQISTGQAYEYKYGSDGLVAVANPVGEDIGAMAEPSSGSSIVPEFCEEYVNTTKRKIVAVHVAKGGEKISSFVPPATGSENLYTDILMKYGACLTYLTESENFIVGKKFYIMFQGESDSLATDTNTTTPKATYKAQYMQFHNSLKTEYGMEFGALIQTGRNTNISYDGIISIAQAKFELAFEENDIIMLNQAPMTYFHSESSQYMLTDNIHYNSAGLQKIAQDSCSALCNYLGYGETNKKGVDPVTYLECPSKPQSITLTENIVVEPNKSASMGYTLVGTPLFGNQVSNQPIDVRVGWSSSNEAVATVADGVITGVAEGTVNITCTSLADTNVTATVSVSIALPKLIYGGTEYKAQSGEHLSDDIKSALPQKFYATADLTEIFDKDTFIMPARDITVAAIDEPLGKNALLQYNGFVCTDSKGFEVSDNQTSVIQSADGKMLEGNTYTIANTQSQAAGTMFIWHKFNTAGTNVNVEGATFYVTLQNKGNSDVTIQFTQAHYRGEYGYTTVGDGNAKYTEVFTLKSQESKDFVFHFNTDMKGDKMQANASTMFWFSNCVSLKDFKLGMAVSYSEPMYTLTLKGDESEEDRTYTVRGGEAWPSEVQTDLPKYFHVDGKPYTVYAANSFVMPYGDMTIRAVAEEAHTLTYNGTTYNLQSGDALPAEAMSALPQKFYVVGDLKEILDKSTFLMPAANIEVKEVSDVVGTPIHNNYNGYNTATNGLTISEHTPSVVLTESGKALAGNTYTFANPQKAGSPSISVQHKFNADGTKIDISNATFKVTLQNKGTGTVRICFTQAQYNTTYSSTRVGDTNATYTETFDLSEGASRDFVFKFVNVPDNLKQETDAFTFFWFYNCGSLDSFQLGIAISYELPA